LKSDLRKLATENTVSDFLEAMDQKGFEARPGRKAGVYRVFLGEIEIGSLDRLTRLPRQQLHEAIIARNSVHGIAVKRTAKIGLADTDGPTVPVPCPPAVIVNIRQS